MNLKTTINILRNPHGWDEDIVNKAMLKASEILENVERLLNENQKHDGSAQDQGPEKT